MRLRFNFGQKIPLGCVCIGLLLAGCDAPTPPKGRMIESQYGPPIERYHVPEKVALGEQVYLQHCASCHGQDGEGDPNWRIRDADNMFPPPPLNGTGHAWHHSKAWLKQMILDGSEAGKGKMPAWRGQVSDSEAEAVIEWFQSKWPDRLYAVWYDAQQRNGE